MAGKSPCPIIGCQEHREGDRPLCMPHWRLVSRATQREFWSAFDGVQQSQGPLVQEALGRQRTALNKAIKEAGGK